MAKEAPKEPGIATIYRWLNSPLAISVAGAVFLAWATNNWERQESIVQLQRETLLVFADDFSKMLSILPGSKSRGLYIRKNRDVEESAREPFADSRSFEATIQHYETIGIQLQELRDPYSLTAQVKAAFSKQEIHDSASRLDKLVDRMDTTGKMDEFLRLNEEAYSEYQQLLTFMGRQIRE